MVVDVAVDVVVDNSVDDESDDGIVLKVVVEEISGEIADVIVDEGVVVFVETNFVVGVRLVNDDVPVEIFREVDLVVVGLVDVWFPELLVMAVVKSTVEDSEINKAVVDFLVV